MTRILISCLVAGAIFVVIDIAWLLAVMRQLLNQELGAMLVTEPRLVPAALFYLIYPVGLTVFAVLPAVAADDARRALALGALLGFVAYATYDLTNLATLRDWTLRITVVDILRGTALSAFAAFISASAALRWAAR